MKIRIFRGMLLLGLLGTLLCAVALSGVFYARVSGVARQELRERAELLRVLRADTPEVCAKLELDGIRLTLVGADGTVLYDNEADAAGMENHSDREEVWEALSVGIGEGKRVSPTLGLDTYYCAVRMENGSVLRLAKTDRSVWNMFAASLPFAAGVMVPLLLLGWLLAWRMTRQIVRPLNGLAADMSGPETAVPDTYDELAPFVRAITRQRAVIARQLADMESRADTVNAILDNMREGIALLDHQGHVLLVNKSVLGLFGEPERTRSEIVGHNVLELFRDVELTAHLHRALAGVKTEAGYACAGRRYQVFFSPAETENSEPGAIVLFLDITEKAQAEKMRREFSANVSHELKTPLTSILGYAEMMTGGLTPPDSRDITNFAGRIRDEAQRLITLIEDIIMLSELDETVTPPASQEAVDLAALAAEVAEMLSPAAEKRGVTLRAEPPDGAEPVCVTGSRTMLTELLYNLVDNGIKYNRPGGSVTVSAAREDGQPVLRVTDTGIGIPPAHQERVFERFYRVDASRSKKTGGTGLGLSIVRHIAAVHGGRVTLRSAEGAGTCATVIFNRDP